uniref:MAGUK p55 subfamily member 7 n=1 Tax=Oncorhynchus tshawytscha TaxID=74940 RepID=A0AAZ3SNV6_ONCTS
MPALSTGSGNYSGLHELLCALPSQLQPHVHSQDDSTFLHNMFGERSLHSLVKIHERLQHYEEHSPAPILDSAGSLAADLSEELQGKSASEEISELLNLLAKPHVKSLLSVHDTVAQKSYDPELPPLPDDIDDDEVSVKIIRLVKNKEPLSQSQGAITFKLIPAIKEETPSKEPKMFVKTLFDYDPAEDKAIPCKEAGLAFKRGDILQIMSQDDANWWQAKQDGHANPRAGLIPSKQFQERRFALRRPAASVLQPQKISNRRSSGFRRSFRLSRRDKKTNKSMYECKKSEQYDMADVATYEEVTPHRRQSGAKHRLVVLVGPTGVGLNELKRKLLISDPQHFSVTVPHTSRPKRNQENEGVEYHFISKNIFETDIHNNKFIEHGEYKGNYYGTSLDSVRSVLSKNKVCLLDVQPHTIKHLRTAEFKPYVVFVKPPPVERLRESRRNAKVIPGKDDKGSAKSFSEEDFLEMVSTAQQMESQHGHLFEKIIVNDDLTAAFTELKVALKKVETDTHWVPISWTHS